MIRIESAFAVFCLLLLTTAAVAQKDQKKEEGVDYYKKWLEEDVVYIISPEEAGTFLKLTTDAERDAFIEQFWLRRDPDQTTALNEFKEEHYRRIAYANENFHSGVAGWRTDRGMIYIKFGPPTGVEKHPEGGSYARKPQEGGGVTATYPFEVWFYNYIEGVGDGIEIEFVDPTKTNEYRIARDADEKDAHLYVPGAGETLAERLGLQTRRNRIRLRGIGNQDDTPLETGEAAVFRPLSSRDMPFERLQRLFKLQKAPLVHYKDLERVVTTRISYDQLPLIYRADQLQVTSEVFLIPITLFFQNRDLSFRPLERSEEASRATVVVYGRLETLAGRVDYVFEDTIHTDLTSAEREARLKGSSIFQRRLPFQEPGRYKLSLVARDEHSGKMATLEKLLVVPRPDKNKLSASTAILTREIVPTPDLEAMGDPFVLGQYRVVPTVDSRFRASDGKVQVFFEVYNFQVDQASLDPSVKVEITLLKGSQTVFPFVDLQNEFELSGNRLIMLKTIPFQGLAPDSYTLRFRITDLIADQSLEKQVSFVIEP